MRNRTGYLNSFNPLLTIITACVLVFIASLVAPGIKSFLGLSPATFPQHFWTIITSLFVHAGFSHLIFNMLALFFFGSYVVRLVGWNNFLTVYLSGGIVGNIFFLLMPSSPTSLVVGASGAIFALGGVLAMIVPKAKVILFPIPVPMPLWFAVVLSLTVLWLMASVSSIAWQAHLGGFLFGLAAGFYFKRHGRYYA